MNEESYNIADRLPQSLDRDNVREVARVIDEKLHEIDAMSELVGLYPRIDKLSSNLIDALAIQLHVDFYDTELPLDIRRELVKNSVLWHMKKGTPFAVKGVLSTVFDVSCVEEWYNYNGEPYHFKVATTWPEITKEEKARLRKAIESVKNTRSWLDAFRFIANIEDDSKADDDVSLRLHPRFVDRYPYESYDYLPYHGRDGLLHDGAHYRLGYDGPTIDKLRLGFSMRFSDDLQAIAAVHGDNLIRGGGIRHGPNVYPFDNGGHIFLSASLADNVKTADEEPAARLSLRPFVDDLQDQIQAKRGKGIEHGSEKRGLRTYPEDSEAVIGAVHYYPSRGMTSRDGILVRGAKTVTGDAAEILLATRARRNGAFAHGDGAIRGIA